MLTPTVSRLNLSLLENLFQETINKAAKNMDNIDYYHGDEMSHM